MSAKNLADERLGMSNKNLQGSMMTIVEYAGVSDFWVEFDTGNKKHCSDFRMFVSGRIINYEIPTRGGMGIVGESGVTYNEDGERKASYRAWSHIITRITRQDDASGKYRWWKGCSISENFKHYVYFDKWFEDNLWDKSCAYVDKDLLCRGNRVYSENTCCLVDNRLNSLLARGNKNCSRQFPIGVSYYKRKDKYLAYCSTGYENGKGKKTYLGMFDTPEEAFYAYKTFKESYIKQIADEYKEKYPKFPKKLHEALYAYTIEITD